jgi:hypothetical protein
MLFTIVQINAFSNDYSTISKNPKIVDSLQRLESIHKGDVLSILYGNNPTGQPIRVMFRELEVYGLGNCEAVTMRTKSGGVVIYINKKHQDAPSEAIACLIAHESQHSALTGTMQEEVRAWIQEVTTWNSFLRQNKDLAYMKSPLTKRLNYLGRLYNSEGQKQIEAVIAKQPIYAGLN